MNWDRWASCRPSPRSSGWTCCRLLAAPVARGFLAAAAVNDRLCLALRLRAHRRAAAAAVRAVVPRRATDACRGDRRDALALGLVAHAGRAGAGLAGDQRRAGGAGRVPEVLRLDLDPALRAPAHQYDLAGLAWALVAACCCCSAVLLPQAGARAVAVADAATCNGCWRCSPPMPDAAVTMVPYWNERVGDAAQVDADLCAGLDLRWGLLVFDAVRSVAQARHGHPRRSSTAAGAPGAAAERGSRRARRAVVSAATMAPAARGGARREPFEPAGGHGRAATSFIEYVLRDALWACWWLCGEGGGELLGQAWTRAWRRREPDPPSVDASVVRLRWSGERRTCWRLAGKCARRRAGLLAG